MFSPPPAMLARLGAPSVPAFQQRRRGNEWPSLTEMSLVRPFIGPLRRSGDAEAPIWSADSACRACATRPVASITHRAGGCSIATRR